MAISPEIIQSKMAALENFKDLEVEIDSFLQEKESLNTLSYGQAVFYRVRCSKSELHKLISIYKNLGWFVSIFNDTDDLDKTLQFKLKSIC